MAFALKADIGAGAVAIGVACRRIILAETVVTEFAIGAIAVAIAGALARDTATRTTTLVVVTIAVGTAAAFFGHTLVALADFATAALAIAVALVADQIRTFVFGGHALVSVAPAEL